MIEQELPLLSVVIPLYNEESHLNQVIQVLLASLEKIKNPIELILVDDGSRDQTWALIQLAASADPRILGIRLSRNFGKEAALIAGLERASGRAVIAMDGDLQHPPELIPKMVELWMGGNLEIVEAVKNRHEKNGLLKRTGAWLFNRLHEELSGIPMRGATDFKLLDRKVVDALTQIGERNLFFRGICGWMGFRRVEIGFDVDERIGGKTKWSTWMSIRLALTGITSYSSLPLHITTLLGAFFLLFSFLLGMQTLYMKFTGQAVSGFSTVILLLLIIGSTILISIGIMGTYLARIFDEVKGRPRYLASEWVGGPRRKDRTETPTEQLEKR